MSRTRSLGVDKLIVNLACISVMFPTWRQKIMERSFRGSVGSNDIFIGFKRSIIFRALPRRGRQETGGLVWRGDSWLLTTDSFNDYLLCKGTWTLAKYLFFRVVLQKLTEEILDVLQESRLCNYCKNFSNEFALCWTVPFTPLCLLFAELCTSRLLKGVRAN